MKIALIGRGAIARYVEDALAARGHSVNSVLVRPDIVDDVPGLYVGSVEDLPGDTEFVIDCAGHEALATHGPEILARGFSLITVSIGALADQQIADRLETAVRKKNATLYLASGAVGALDCLRAAAIGTLETVTYTGRKPPEGWRGSPADDRLNLDNLTEAVVHFEGSARQAALAYPKNANVAAAVALAGTGLDKTRVCLIADPSIDRNVHQIEATGDFGHFRFEISGNSLPDTPRSSALAAMSVLAKLEQITKPVSI